MPHIPIIAVAALLFASAALAQSAPNPRALDLFERDWVLMHWARKSFDADGDGVLSIDEAQPAARAFRDIADGDIDGRVTTYEYDRAREFIIARHAPAWQRPGEALSSDRSIP